MEVFLMLAAGLVWWATGAVCFVYWWTKESDLCSGELFVMTVVGLIGPIAFLAGWMVHGVSRPGRVLLRRRG